MRSDTDATVIGVSAAIVYDVISATNSSPQTTEINAKKRAATLMKWVHIGLVQAALFVFIMVVAEPRGKRWRPMLGGILAMALLYGQYIYAKVCGVKSGEEGTEDYGFADHLQRGRRRGL